ncbi:toll/interleukin-1 receptor domain-containing protein [Actinosynnema sp. NPDC059797]
MTRVFLSYAKEDSSIALRVRDELRKSGADVYRFEDPERAGDRFMQVIPREIDQADAFLALMSPAALESRFCQAEHELAVHRELSLGGNFIYVLEVAPTPKEGWLRIRSWIDLTSHVTEDELTNAVRALPLAQEPAPEVAGLTKFRNRHQELERIMDGITTFGGDDHWLVLSPPKMGKSWFLKEVRERFSKKDGRWTRLVDLRDEELDTRYDELRVLSRLLAVEPPASNLDGDARLDEIAGAVAMRANHQLVLLDSAELLDLPTTGRFRRALRNLRKLLQDSPHRPRLSVVIGSRREEGWTGAGTSTGDRFRSMSLTGFEPLVVRQVLNDTGLHFRESALENWAMGLHGLSRGLPALLVSSLEWAGAKGFVNPGSCGYDTTFDAVVTPYIKRELLSIHSLLPKAGDKLVERHKALLAAVQVLAPYRIVTTSHLKHHLNLNPAFSAALESAEWSVDGLWTAIEGTALLLARDNELWLSHYPPIRQLLYEHFYRDIRQKHATHVRARAFYDGWVPAGAGTEQARVLVESLWHEATMLCCVDSPDTPRQLPKIAVELTRRFIKPALYDPVEMERGVRQQLFNDDEFVQLISGYDGLLDEVVAQVRATIAGGG